MIIKSKSFKNFTVVNNEIIRDTSLSFKAKGLYLLLASFPEDWTIHKSTLHKYSSDGQDGVRSAFDELVSNGLILAVKKIQANGQFEGWDYIVYPEKQEKPILEKPIRENPISVFPDSNNKEYTNKENTNTVEYTPPTWEQQPNLKTEKKKTQDMGEKFIPPTVDDVVQYFKEKGYSELSARKAFNYYSVAEWKDSKGAKVKNWKQKMIGVWFKDENKQAITTTESSRRFKEA